MVVPNEENPEKQRNQRNLENQRSPRDAEHTEENKPKTLYNYTIAVIKFLTIN
jgi:hypothetical protein